MNSNVEVQQKIIENWLQNYHSTGNLWKLAVVKNVGRGLIATRDIGLNELILCEPPLIIGPVGYENETTFVCMICYKLISKIDSCSKCSLPMCSDCSTNYRHVECTFLKSLNLDGKKSSLPMVLRCLTAIRGLFLNENEKSVLNLLQCNRTSDTEKVIDDLLKEDNGRNESIRNELVNVFAVLNTNAFQIVTSKSNYSLNLRGLYPLMSLINHSCTSNARYCTDNNYVTNLFARKPIKMGEEISISYAKILWGTPSRQSYLKITKQFTCKCDRCMDPTEGSTFLAAFKCFDRTCSGGLVLPVDPVNFASSWKCGTCSRLSEYKTVLRSQDVVSCMINGISDGNSIKAIDEFITNRLLKVLPASNQYVVELKMKIISCNVKDQSIDDYQLIEKYCHDILELLVKLQAGECTLKGLAEFKLYQCRQLIMDTGKYSMSEFESNQRKLLMNAWSILKDNVSAPVDLASTVEKFMLCNVRISS